ncbi:hypothetical protein BVIET440_230023 [Burkholderia vietnamiensis]
MMDRWSSDKNLSHAFQVFGQSAFGAIAKRLCSGLQSRLGRFDSGSRLQVGREKALRNQGFFFSAARAALSSATIRVLAHPSTGCIGVSSFS